MCILFLLYLAVGSVQSQEKLSVTIEYIAHASFRITAPSGERLLLDPYGSRIWIGYDFPTGVDADTVLITHPHYDHDGGTSRGQQPPWPDTADVLREPGTHKVDGFGVLGVAGKHADPYGKEFGQTNTIWVLDVAGLRIAHIGDNGPVSQQAAAEIGKVDILMMPIDSQYHILKEREIQSIQRQLDPSILVPMHYRIEDLEAVEGEPDDLGGIDGWLEGNSNVHRLGRNQLILSLDDLPEVRKIVVFDHSPTLQRP